MTRRGPGDWQPGVELVTRMVEEETIEEKRKVEYGEIEEFSDSE